MKTQNHIQTSVFFVAQCFFVTGAFSADSRFRESSYGVGSETVCPTSPCVSVANQNQVVAGRSQMAKCLRRRTCWTKMF